MAQADVCSARSLAVGGLFVALCLPSMVLQVDLSCAAALTVQVWRGAAGAAAGQGLTRTPRAAHDRHTHPTHPGGLPPVPWHVSNDAIKVPVKHTREDSGCRQHAAVIMSAKSACDKYTPTLQALIDHGDMSLVLIQELPAGRSPVVTRALRDDRPEEREQVRMWASGDVRTSGRGWVMWERALRCGLHLVAMRRTCAVAGCGSGCHVRPNAGSLPTGIHPHPQMYAHIREEMAQGHGIYIVCPFVEQSDKMVRRGRVQPIRSIVQLPCCSWRAAGRRLLLL